MKPTILAAALLLAAIPAQATQYGLDAQLAAMACTGSRIKEATRGDFRFWVLPSFVPGDHMKAGDYIEPVKAEDGVWRCNVVRRERMP